MAILLVGSTLEPFQLTLPMEKYKALTFDEYQTQIRKELVEFRDKIKKYYVTLRRKETGWANIARRMLAYLGVAALVLATLSSAVKIFTGLPNVFGYGLDVWFAFLALAAYAVIGGISFFERATDTTASYFRHLDVEMAIRDLWTTLEFSLLEVVTATKSGDEASEKEGRGKVIALAKAFCDDLNKISRGELGGWRTGFLASLSFVESAAKQGIEDMQKALQVTADAAKEAAKKAADAANEARIKAEEAAEAARRATEPASANVTIVGEFDGSLTVLVDGNEVTRTSSRSVAIDRLRPGSHKFVLQGKKGDHFIDASKMVDLKPGVQAIELSVA